MSPSGFMLVFQDQSVHLILR